MLPMPTDLDIYRSAKLLVEQHGQDALIEAAMKADQLLERGDLDGRRIWTRIGAANVGLARSPGPRSAAAARRQLENRELTVGPL